ncbi:hypothetical protein [Nannocystis punicea]|uniref:Uncharacterized protein n=1 Tax=Nannocystis punicea TaxID=2995304 RepID=A0ABY7H4S8_9BACT|nr:hypothetical protein [Nannocystis poenicansa]WAS94192.1 hypothetical protein O0S08_49350 [Nannocystis poenicansa]
MSAIFDPCASSMRRTVGGRWAAGVLIGVALSACASRAASEATTPVPSEPQSAAPVAVEPTPDAPAASVIPADPSEQVDFEPSALAFGRCRSDEADGGPFVVGRDAESWREGEPLWVMTNAGGAVRGAAGKQFEYCGPGLTQPTATGSSEETCVKAVAVVTEGPLRCDESPGNGAARPFTSEPGPQLDYVFAFHRRHRPPTPVRMNFAMRVHAVCQDPAKDFDEPGAMIPVRDGPSPIDKFFEKEIAGLDKRSWRAVRVELEGSNEPLHVLHAAEHQRKAKVAQWSVLREKADGSASELVAKADRSWPDSFLLRDHQCGLPFSPPLPALAFMHGQKLHWVTVEDVNAKAIARVWEVGDQLRRVAVLPVALSSPKW